MKIAVYTVIVGLYDMIKPIKTEFLQDADFFLFSDIMGTNPGYKTISISKTHEDSRVESRKYKMLPNRYLPGYDYYLYLDGTMELLASPRKLVEKYLQDKNIAIFNHPYRKTLFEEFYYCYFWKPEIRKNMEEMMQFFLTEGVPEATPLTENGVILRRNTEETRTLDGFWWNIFEKFPTRDQLSLPYCLWKLGVGYNEFDGLSVDSNEFKLYKHI